MIFFIEFSSVLVGCHSVGHVNAGIVIRINISVDLSQRRGYIEVVNMEAGGDLHTSAVGIIVTS